MVIEIYEEQPEGFSPTVEVAATYVQMDGKLLLLKRAKDKPEPSTWGVPAGKLEGNESPIKGAKRELFEETGIKMAHENLFQMLGKLYIRKPGIDYIYHAFGLMLEREPTIHLSDEHVAYEWVFPHEAEKLPLMNGAKKALDFYCKHCL